MFNFFKKKEFVIRDLREDRFDRFIKYGFIYLAGVASYWIYFMLKVPLN